ncbi:MAG: hypothetical protein ABIW80_16005 [Lapillicoccus sp.]
MNPRGARVARAARRSWGRWVAVAGGVAGLVVAQALPAQARGGSFDDRQVVQLSRAGAVRGAGGLEVHLTSRQAVRATNLALATTTCDDCRATAVSFQVVVADRSPDSIDVGNLAYAGNEGCARCDSVAVAYQFVLADAADVRLSADGRRRLERIDAALGALARSGTSVVEVQRTADGYAQQVLDILATEVHARPALRKDVRHTGGPVGGPAGGPRTH